MAAAPQAGDVVRAQRRPIARRWQVDPVYRSSRSDGDGHPQVADVEAFVRALNRARGVDVTYVVFEWPNWPKLSVIDAEVGHLGMLDLLAALGIDEGVVPQIFGPVDGLRPGGGFVPGGTQRLADILKVALRVRRLAADGGEVFLVGLPELVSPTG